MTKTTPKAPRQAKSASASAVNAATAGQAASDGENAAARRARQFAEWLKTHPSGPNKAPRRSDDEVLAEARAKYYKGASTGPTTSPAAPALKISSQPEVREAKAEVGETPESARLESLARELGVRGNRTPCRQARGHSYCGPTAARDQQGTRTQLERARRGEGKTLPRRDRRCGKHAYGSDPQGIREIE